MNKTLHPAFIPKGLPKAFSPVSSIGDEDDVSFHSCLLSKVSYAIAHDSDTGVPDAFHEPHRSRNVRRAFFPTILALAVLQANAAITWAPTPGTSMNSPAPFSWAENLISTNTDYDSAATPSLTAAGR